MAQAGGNALFLSSKDMQLGRGKRSQIPRSAFAICGRDYDPHIEHEKVEGLPSTPKIPVINGLTDLFIRVKRLVTY